MSRGVLVLSRKEGERIIIECTDGIIELMVEETKNTRTVLSFKAPTMIRIHRSELLERGDRYESTVN